MGRTSDRAADLSRSQPTPSEALKQRLPITGVGLWAEISSPSISEPFIAFGWEMLGKSIVLAPGCLGFEVSLQLSSKFFPERRSELFPLPRVWPLPVSLTASRPARMEEGFSWQPGV